MSKYLVIGQGSMGKRRVRCLLANGVMAEQVEVFDTREDRLQESQAKYSVKTTSHFESALRTPELVAVFVSVPGFLHMRYCLAAAKAGKHWFCEVPLSVSLDGIEELKGLTCDNHLVGAPGCQMLFYPLGRALKSWAASPLGTPVLAGSYTIGDYLPEWHPYEDYRQFYASNKAMGGGNLDVIAFDLTWLRWILDRPINAVTCRTSKTSSLELSPGTPDHQEMIVEFEGGLMLSMHYDVLDRSHESTLRLVAENSTVKRSSLEEAFHLYDANTKEWRRQSEPPGYDYETCYHDEIGQFLRCIETKEPWPVSLETAEEIVRCLVALETSDRDRRSIQLQEVS